MQWFVLLCGWMMYAKSCRHVVSVVLGIHLKLPQVAPLADDLSQHVQYTTIIMHDLLFDVINHLLLAD